MLHYACMCQHAGLIPLLICRYRANVNLQDKVCVACTLNGTAILDCIHFVFETC
jgi:hypothetical protein